MKFSAFPVIRYLFCFIAGILAYFQTNYFHTTFYYLGIGLFLALLFSASGRWAIIRGTLACLLFFCSGWILTYRNTATSHPGHFSNQGAFTYYQVTVTSNAQIKPRTYKAESEILAIKTNKGWKKADGKVLLYFDRDAVKRPVYGDVFLIKGAPQPVDSPRNPEEFDYRQFLQYKGIYAQQFLWNREYVLLGNNPPSAILSIANKANAYADSVFKTYLKTRNEYAVANAMIVGLRDDIDDDLLSAYSASGAIHVLSVSGMHVAILFAMLVLVFSSIKKQGKYGSWAFLFIVLGILWAYAVFTGLSSTVLRATVTFSLILIGTTLNRAHNIYNTLAVSALILLWWNPYWLVDIGFQLSYLAIIGIVYLYPYLNQMIHPTNRLIRITWEGSIVCFAAQLFTTPLSIYYFHQFPTYFLIANPFVALFSAAILPAGLLLLFFSWVPLVSDLLAVILKCFCYLLNETILAFEKMPFSSLKGFSISVPELLVWYIVAGLIIAFFRHSELKYLQASAGLIVCLVLVNIYEDYRQNQQKALTFHFIPKQTGISIIDGKSATFMADSVVIGNEKNYSYHLKNYYDKMGISNRNMLNAEKYTDSRGIVFFEFEGKKIVWLKQPFKGQLRGKTDYVLLSNNAVRNLTQVFADFQTGLIIVDDSNRKYLIENLKQQADGMGFRLIALNQTGAYSVSTH